MPPHCTSRLITTTLLYRSNLKLSSDLLVNGDYNFAISVLRFLCDSWVSCYGDVCGLSQVNVFLSRLNGDPIGFSVVGIFVIDKNTVLTVRTFYKIVPIFESCICAQIGTITGCFLSGRKWDDTRAYCRSELGIATFPAQIWVKLTRAQHWLFFSSFPAE